MCVVTETLHYIRCPHCGKGRSRICHLFGQKKSFGGWFCNVCGGCYGGTVDGTDVTVEKVANRKDNTTVFLRHGNLLIAVKGMMFGGKLSENGQFYYEESTCPVNYLNGAVEAWDLESGEVDPHGIFEFISEVPEMSEKELADIVPREFLECLD